MPLLKGIAACAILIEQIFVVEEDFKELLGKTVIKMDKAFLK
ncbi:hypothetical protein [Psychrobacillus sp. NPDC093180]